MGDQQLLLILLLLSLGVLGIFVRNFKRNKTDLANGLIFNIFLLVLSVAIVVAGILYDSPLIKLLFFAVLILYLLVGVLAWLFWFWAYLRMPTLCERGRESLSKICSPCSWA